MKTIPLSQRKGQSFQRSESSSRREESFHRRLRQRLVGEWSRLGLRSRPWCISVGKRVRVWPV
ncbi:hypothetical protein RHGRI_036888 [Rhododendron griersonianum]|uniref:Ribosomal protein S14 n=1 Tax=Rhododendron griersonianum TaxID=479676 RepID=A0AAV6HV63_9ERIC|nr:hypothetical protein RHGRI_036888 [Rhododendron griersonianum]